MRPAFKLPQIGPRARKVLIVVGYVFAGLFAFIYAFHLTFPYDRLKDKGVEALSSKYDVSVGGVERGWLPGSFSLTRVQLRTRPEKAGEVPKLIFIDRIDVDVALLSVIGGAVDVDVDATMGPGRITGTFTIGKDQLKASVKSRNLPLSDVPGLASIIGMPMGGRGDVTARLDLPRNDWSRATARLAIKCPGCTVGGEGAFFKPRTTTRTSAFVGEGVPVPLLAITNLEADWSIAAGKITTNKFLFVSPHLAVELEFSATIDKELKNARVENACLRYRGSAELKELDENFYNALELTGGPLGADEMRHLKLVGTLSKFKALGRECGGAADREPDPVSGEPRGRRTPDLSAVPDPTDREPGTPAKIDVDPPVQDPAGATGETITPRPDDVRPADEDGEEEGEVKEIEKNGAPPEGSPTTRGDAAQPTGGDAEAPAAPPPSGNDSVQFEGQPTDENPPEQPPEE